MDSDASTVNPWPGLTHRAREGELRLDPEAARTAADYAADALYAVFAVEDRLSDIRVHTGFSDNGHLNSATTLAARYDESAHDLGRILVAHKAILTAMSEHFVVAGKLFRDSEEDRKVTIGRIASGAQLRGATYPPAPVAGKSTPPRDAPKPEPAGTNPIDAENPYGQTVKWFYLAGAGMQPQPPTDAAATWGWMAERLNTAFTTFAGQLQEMEKKGAWTGRAINAAIDAANAYRDNVDALSGAMRQVAGSLNYASSWLAHTKVAMPTSPRPAEPGSAAEDKIVNDAILAWLKHYEPGLTGSSLAIPILPEARSTPPEMRIQQSPTETTDREPKPTSEATADQRAEPSLDRLFSQASSLLQQGTQLAQPLVSNPVLPPLTSAALDPAKPSKPAGGIGGPGPGPTPRSLVQQSAKLFPRAAVAPATPVVSAGTAGAMSPGIPGMAPPIGGAGMMGGRPEHKRAEFLSSEDNMDEAIGGDPVAYHAVLQQ
ncbi:PPE domain-containing protein [Nocardia altamirensis]|uniref:PPE domain-containing protein n=1 Tax=Nocardia altamirensis TaxID=472158 RepID=UPI0008401A1E|nr:hypothetical protein [Nocardia altamirensis]